MSDVSRARIIASVDAYKRPSGTAPFVESLAASEDDIEAAHRAWAWAIAGRTFCDAHNEMELGE